MNTNETPSDQHDRIERFLQNALSDQERTEFELEMFENSEFAADVEIHQTLKRALKNAPLSEWDRSATTAPKPGWLESLWQNATLAWLTAGGCAAALVLSVVTTSRNNPGFAISDELAIHSYRGQSQPTIESTLSTRSADAYLLLSIDTPHVRSAATLSISAPGRAGPLINASGTTDDMGTFTLVVPSDEIPVGTVNLSVRHENGAVDKWAVAFR